MPQVNNTVETNTTQVSIDYWREHLKNGLCTLKSDFLKKPNNARLFRQHCKLIDQMLMLIWKQAHFDMPCCLIAVGGYGRGELYPHSDIDLLILLPDLHEEHQYHHINGSIEALVGFLWDIGLNVGHSVRHLSECMLEANSDITIQTNLIESRLLAGSSLLYQDFLIKINGTFDDMTKVAVFFAAKLKEQSSRHAKFNDTAYNLEPNIKESPGGLRDLHIIWWITQSLNIANNRKFLSKNTWAMLAKQGIITALEARQIERHQRNLQRLRIHLHLMSYYREDRLLFDFQNELAASLGYMNTATKRASEQLMQSYYRSAKLVSLFNEVLIKSFQRGISTTPSVIRPITADFESHDNLLEAKTSDLLEKQPSAIFEAFLLLAQHPEIQGMGAMLVRNMQRAKSLVNHNFRKNEINKKKFIEILSQAHGVNHALHSMNRYGILGSYIPAFNKIIGQMQHDLFHVYTVDEHILNVVGNLHRFAKPALAHEFPLCSQLFAEFDAPYLLYLAALFHDIAKGRGGDHSKLGMADAMHFCTQHKLPKKDADLVAWLVYAHLKMSSTAQKSDLSDPSVIETFARFVQSERKLTALYLLTVADIRGTSPLVWNTWKAVLLENLFYATKAALVNQVHYAQQAVETRKAEAIERLQKFGLNDYSYLHLWKNFGSSYFIRHESHEIAWHSRLLTPHLNTNKPIVRTRLSPNGEGIQVMIYSKDQKGLFARICNFFDQMHYSIVEAKIYTTDHNYSLDSFIILDQQLNPISYSGLLKFIETKLTQKLDNRIPLEAPLRGRISRQVKHMPIPAKVTITQESDHNHHKLEIVANDRPGLLTTLAHQFLIHKIELHNAKINTLGKRAEDTFLISADKGKKLDALRILELRKALLAEL